jgi:Transcription factor WhiB
MTARGNRRDDAACRDADPDLFFPVGTTGPARRQIGEAKRVCRTCPAQTQCLAWALDNREYMRRLLREKQPEFSAALELAMNLVRLREPRSREIQRDISASEIS